MSALAPMENRLPVGPGSRGGRWHEAEFRRLYHAAWRAGHPEYRERERLRSARGRARRNGDPADIVVPNHYPRPLPEPAVTCGCACGCREPVVTRCGFCRDGIHTEVSHA
jgi:hypothetical protein